MNSSLKILIGIILIVVFGTCIYKYFPNRVEVEKEVDIKVNNSFEDETSDWLVYAGNGFSIKYPNFIAQNQITNYEDEGLTCFSYYYPSLEDPTIYNTFCVGVDQNPLNIQLNDWVSQNEICGIDQNSFESINMAELEGMKVKGKGACPPGASGIVYKAYLEKDSNIYTLRLTEERILTKTLEVEQNQNQIFDKMLSTFQVF